MNLGFPFVFLAWLLSHRSSAPPAWPGSPRPAAPRPPPPRNVLHPVQPRPQPHPRNVPPHVTTMPTGRGVPVRPPPAQHPPIAPPIRRQPPPPIEMPTGPIMTNLPVEFPQPPPGVVPPGWGLPPGLTPPGVRLPKPMPVDWGLPPGLTPPPDVLHPPEHEDESEHDEPPPAKKLAVVVVQKGEGLSQVAKRLGRPGTIDDVKALRQANIPHGPDADWSATETGNLARKGRPGGLQPGDLLFVPKAWQAEG